MGFISSRKKAVVVAAVIIKFKIEIGQRYTSSQGVVVKGFSLKDRAESELQYKHKTKLDKIIDLQIFFYRCLYR